MLIADTLLVGEPEAVRVKLGLLHAAGIILLLVVENLCQILDLISRLDGLWLQRFLVLLKLGLRGLSLLPNLLCDQLIHELSQLGLKLELSGCILAPKAHELSETRIQVIDGILNAVLLLLTA